MITRETANLNNTDFQLGEAILVDKPAGWSSFKVVHKIRKATGVKKVGHAGTLDPMATGLLILCTGKMTKEISKYQGLEKTYTGKILLGKSSISMDLETPISEEKSIEGITDEQVIKVKDEFIGKIFQTPPMFSAVKIKGKSLYKLARKGKTVERQPREVNVSQFEILNINFPVIEFLITCSKGTYIRAIADDLGKKLGCGGILASLRRTKIGSFSVDKAITVTDFINKFSSEKEKQAVHAYL